MSHPPPASPNPFGDDAPATDQVGLAANAIGAGAAGALTILSGATFITGTLTESRAVTSLTDVSPDDAQVNIIVFGVVLALAVSAGTAWVLMSPVRQAFRRFGLSVVAAFGGFVAAAILTTILRETTGLVGLLGLAGIGAGGVWYFSRKARASA